MLNGYEIVLILALALIFFGAKKLPELAKGLGHGIREFKKATREVTSEFQEVTSELERSNPMNYSAPEHTTAYEPTPHDAYTESHADMPATSSAELPAEPAPAEKAAEPPQTL